VSYSYSDSNITSPIAVTGSGANAQVQTVIETRSVITYLAIIFQAVSGGNFASQNATVEVSNDNSTFYTVDSSIALGTSTLAAKSYGPGSLGTTLAVNAALFKYIRITIPAISLLTCRIVYSMK
jgi:hypothetical protein